MKIKLTDFALRHFDKNSSGTKILNMTPADFEKEMNCVDVFRSLNASFQTKCPVHLSGTTVRVVKGYAPFCKLLSVKNFTDAKVGTLPINLSNYQYLRSGYSARRGTELPVLSRWFELPTPKPRAEWLVIVLYDKEQMNIELENEYKKALELYNKETDSEPVKATFDGDWGIVSILGQSHPNEEPMTPITIIRNAYMYGGSGHPIDEKYYDLSVEFWENNAILK